MNYLAKKYRPDLGSFMATSTANYAKIIKLLPQIKQMRQEGETVEFLISNQPNLQISLLQASRFTQTFSFKQVDSELHFNRDLCVRMYHDAQLAEVLSGVHDAMLKPINKIPNQEMKQVDEKAQLNRFLGEWLGFCLEFGISNGQDKTHLAFLS